MACRIFTAAHRLSSHVAQAQWLCYGLSYPVVQTAKNLPAMQETRVRSLDWEDLLEKGMATHSNILAWRIPWTIMGLQRVGHD